MVEHENSAPDTNGIASHYLCNTPTLSHCTQHPIVIPLRTRNALSHLPRTITMRSPIQRLHCNGSVTAPVKHAKSQRTPAEEGGPTEWGEPATAPVRHAKSQGKPSEEGVPTEHGCAHDCASKRCEVAREAGRRSWADRVGGESVTVPIRLAKSQGKTS